MDLAPATWRRIWPRSLALCAALFAAGLLLRCGSDKDEKKDDPAPTPAAVPATWDGKSDWNQSAWKATDE